MQLEKKDVDLFYKLYEPLLVYANKKGKISWTPTKQKI